jgi:hypothetical protein
MEFVKNDYFIDMLKPKDSGVVLYLMNGLENKF